MCRVAIGYRLSCGFFICFFMVQSEQCKTFQNTFQDDSRQYHMFSIVQQNHCALVVSKILSTCNEVRTGFESFDPSCQKMLEDLYQASLAGAGAFGWVALLQIEDIWAYFDMS